MPRVRAALVLFSVAAAAALVGFDSIPAHAAYPPDPATCVRVTLKGDAYPGQPFRIRGNAGCANPSQAVEAFFDAVLMASTTAGEKGIYRMSVSIPGIVTFGPHSIIVKTPGRSDYVRPVTVSAAACAKTKGAAKPGQKIAVSGKKGCAGPTATVELFFDLTLLTTSTSKGNGSYKIKGSIPGGASVGAHSITVKTPGRPDYVKSFSVVPPSPSRRRNVLTRTEVYVPVLIVLLALGGLMLGLPRRRRAARFSPDESSH